MGLLRRPPGMAFCGILFILPKGPFQMKMTTEEAFVKVLQRHGIEHVFGIIGSAFMPISDLFPTAGITFWDCAHEGSGGMMADGFTRASGKMAMMIAQNGPGITNFVTAVKTAYWNHSPLLLVTPQAANKTIGQGGFQEVEQMALFKDMVAYQEEVRDPSRIAEVLTRVIAQAKRHSAPAQINVPRDMFTQVVDIELPPILSFERPTGGAEAIAKAAALLSKAKFPVILNGAGDHRNAMQGTIEEVSFLGAVVRVRVRFRDNAISLDTFNNPGAPPPERGSPVTVSFQPEDLLVLEGDVH